MRTTFKSPAASFVKVASVMVMLLAAGSLGAQQSFSVKLTGSAEVPPVAGTSAGVAVLNVSADHTLSGSIKVSGFAGTAAHVHEAAAGSNGPVIVKFTKSSDDSFVVPAGTKLTDAQLSSLKSGNLYVNVHSVANPGGEVRAQLSAETAQAPMGSGY